MQELRQQSCLIFLSCIYISKSKSVKIESILEGATKAFSADWEHKKYAESAASSALEQGVTLYVWNRQEVTVLVLKGYKSVLTQNPLLFQWSCSEAQLLPAESTVHIINNQNINILP